MHSIEMLASVPELVDAKTEEKKQTKKQKTTFPPKRSLNGTNRTMTCITLNDFQQENITTVAGLKNPLRILFGKNKLRQIFWWKM